MTGGAPCQVCGVSLPDGARFCMTCGAPVELAPDAGRKTVTLLFCDVLGSTRLGEELDPEVFRAVMGDYFEVARQAVERHGGTVEKFVGDAVLAVFGIPVIREDDALRAVRAAAELRDGLVALSGRLELSNGVRLQIRTGVNTGAVVAGSSRAGGAFATGDAVNTAARLEQAAAPGAVLLGESTYLLVRDAVEVEPAAALLVKGKSRPLLAYELIRVLDVDAGRARRRDSHLVGRDRERRLLVEAFERVVADGRCQLVTVLGPAGIGKTRLLADVEAALPAEVRVLRGRCLSYGRGITFWPIVSVLRQAAGLTGQESTEDASAGLRKVLSDATEGEAAVSRLAPLLGVGGEPGGTEETRWAVRTLLEHLADSTPVVLLLDDLHWAEPALLELLTYLRDECTDVRLLLICLARPELLEQHPDWGGGASNAMTLMLEPLDATHTAALLVGLLGGALPPEVGPAVRHWSDGNPLFVEEMVTHLVEEGLLLREGATWLLTGDLLQVQVPSTVTALLAARLDRLPAAERTLLLHASVIGLELTRDELASVSAGVDVAPLLAAVTRKGLLRRVRGTPGEAFQFRHVLVREAAYDALPKAVRADLHERLADRLASSAADTGGEVDAFIGHHLEQAARFRGELSPGSAAAAELADRAAEALAAAADHARQGDDQHAAEQLLVRSLRLTPPAGDTRRRRLLHLAWVRAARWETSAGRAAAEEGLAVAPERNGDLYGLALSAQCIALRMEAGEHLAPDQARTVSEAAADMARQHGDVDILSHALLLKGMADLMQARWDSVGALAAEMVHVGRPAERREARHLVWAAAEWGSTPFDQVLELVDEAEGEAVASAGLRAHLHGLRAFTYAALGRTAEAVSESALVWQAFGDAKRVGHLVLLLAEVLRSCGDSAAAIRDLREGIARLRESGGLAYASTMLGLLAVLLHEEGDEQGAAATVREAEQVTSPYDVLSVALIGCVDALLASGRGAHVQASELAAQALQVIDESQHPMYRADLRRWLADVPGRAGDQAGQRRLLEQALELYRAKGHLPFIARTEQLLDAIAHGDGPVTQRNEG